MKTKLITSKFSIKLLVFSLLLLFSFSTAIALGLFKYGVEEGACQGCGVCVDVTEYLFEIDDDGLARPTQNDLVFQFERDLVEEAQAQCPACAIWTNF